MAAFGGASIFGAVSRVTMTVAPSAQQVNAFFGVEGNQFLWGGSRGRVFLVEGIFVDTDIPSVMAQQANLLSYADGIARVFTDNQGTDWPNVVFDGTYTPEQGGALPVTMAGGDGWGLRFKCVLKGLT